MSHVWRPLFVVLVFIAAVLAFRAWYVPEGFGSGSRGFMYSFHRKANEQEWKDWPMKYRDTGSHKLHEYCGECHEDEVKARTEKLHGINPCEDCHGPALNHPDDPQDLIVDRSRSLCLRCHADLPYRTSERKRIPGIDPDEHNPGSNCVECHNPHNPRLEDM